MKTILGIIAICLIQAFQFIPLLGSLALIYGVVGWLLGTEGAPRAIGIGLSLLAFRIVVIDIFKNHLKRKAGIDFDDPS